MNNLSLFEVVSLCTGISVLVNTISWTAYALMIHRRARRAP